MSFPTHVSKEGAAFIEGHEGFVSRAYLDPVGVVTIGTGFTNGSSVARQRLGKIKMGMTITREKNREVLAAALDEEYVPPVIRNINPHKQHELDAAASVSFNCGPGSTKWKWAKALAVRDIKTAAARLRVTATTARGKKLPGLVRRRKEEARLLETGQYGLGRHPSFAPAVQVEPAKPDPVLKGFQSKLNKLGFNAGAVDGFRGPATTKAVREFQFVHPDLVVDGILGKATMAQIDRATDMVDKGKKTAGRGAAIEVTTGVSTETAKQTDAPVETVAGWDITAVAMTGVAIVVAAFAVYYAWHYRHEIEAMFRKLKEKI